MVRSVAIATGLPYQQVYDLVNKLSSRERVGKRKRGTSNARTGVHKSTIKWVMEIAWLEVGSNDANRVRVHSSLTSG